MNFSTLLKIGENLTDKSTFGERTVVGLQVVAIGMGVVFGVLILLIGILQLFKLFALKGTKKAEPAKTEVNAPAAAPATSSAPASDEETVVAIATAAIAASRGQSNVDFKILSFAPVGSAPAPATASAPAAAPAAAPVEKTETPAPVAAQAPVANAEGEKISAPLPGNILDVKVSNGASVKKGDILCILEAMKMENEIVAPVDGTIVAINATKGSSVNTGDLLFVIG